MNSRADNKSRADEKCKQDLQNILQARFPLIFLRSAEESRAIKCIIDAHQALVSKFKMKDGELIRWSSVSGFVRHFPQPENPNRFRWEEIDYAKKSGKNSFDESLSFLHKRLQTEAIQKPNSQFTYLLPDWSTFIKPDDEFVARKIKELVISIQQRKTRPRMTLIILGLDWSIPPILRNYVHILDLSLPNEEELYQDLFSKDISKSEDARSLSVQAQGMTRQAVVQLVELMKAQDLLSNFEGAKLEKAFAGVGSDGSEITMRQFGTFLSWLNDHDYPIFFITTSNNTEALPAELFRAGRFDERFIITPPNSNERREILKKRVEAHKLQTLEEKLLNELVEKTEGFTGAEIDKLVREAIYQAHIKTQITDSLKQPDKGNWYDALELVNPQINAPKMKKLLQQYINRINNKESKSASIEDPDFWEKLLKKEN